MDDHLADLVDGDACSQRRPQVGLELRRGRAHRSEHPDGDQLALAQREAGTSVDLPVGELRDVSPELPESLDGLDPTISVDLVQPGEPVSRSLVVSCGHPILLEHPAPLRFHDRHLVTPVVLARVDRGTLAGEDGSMSDLATKECVPCKGGVPPLEGAELDALLAALGGEWTVVDGHHLEKTYPFKNFREALDFTNRVGELAEAQGHHPDIALSWGKVQLTIWTHKIDGLTESDFVFAAKADRALGQG